MAYLAEGYPPDIKEMNSIEIGNLLGKIMDY